MAYWFFGGGLALLVFGSDWIVRGGVGVTHALRLSPLVIGLLVIGAGTTLPEFAVSLTAAQAGAPDIAIANIAGSNILHVLLILGLAALVRPLASSPKVVLRDGGAMLLASVAIALLAVTGTIGRVEGIAMLAAFVLYLAVVLATDWRRAKEHSVSCARAMQHLEGSAASGSVGMFLLLFGIVGLTVGAHFTVAGAEILAREYDLAPATVGATAVAFGASLPELFVTLTAAARRQTHLAIGHLIGSNVFNVLGGLGLTAALFPLRVDPPLQADLFVMALASALILPLLIADWRLTRLRGAFLLVGYAAYLVFLAWRQGWIPAGLIPWA
ncbi:MAG: calcium/sodium antiporter [Alphaproteobacteria bacterium]|nr:calcium/sodium antiporter [Alphaproteobacteria bacterium]MBV9694704.1 calcium/sodium antiporter [Alphaproteobacteria bacterium]